MTTAFAIRIDFTRATDRWTLRRRLSHATATSLILSATTAHTTRAGRTSRVIVADTNLTLERRGVALTRTRCALAGRWVVTYRSAIEVRAYRVRRAALLTTTITAHAIDTIR